MPPELVIFDCDGVLIDSEAIASRLIAAELSGLGWAMEAAEAMERFIGMSIADMVPLIEARLGRILPDGWREGLAAALLRGLAAEATAIPQARSTLLRVHALGLDWRIASNSSRQEMAVKFARAGLDDLTGGRAFSAVDLLAAGGRAKPAPDVFLAAAASAGAAPARCLVLEDSRLGVIGAVAAGMTCYGFAPQGDGGHLRAAGAVRIMRGLTAFTRELERLTA